MTHKSPCIVLSHFWTPSSHEMTTGDLSFFFSATHPQCLLCLGHFCEIATDCSQPLCEGDRTVAQSRSLSRHLMPEVVDSVISKETTFIQATLHHDFLAS